MWKEDPNSVHKSWQVFFKNLEANAAPGTANALPPSLSGALAPAVDNVDPIEAAAVDHMKLLLLVRAYQVHGHYVSHLDPLQISSANIRMQEGDPMPAFLDHKTYGFSDQDLSRPFFMGAAAIGAASAGVLASARPQTLKEILDTLQEAYCGSIGVEFMHIPDMEQANWIRDKFERPNKFSMPKEDVVRTYERILDASLFETFLATKYGVTKRFGLEGLEATIPGIQALIDRAADLGITNVTLGMPHRGRLNVLCNVMRKPLRDMFFEFIMGPMAADSKKDTILGSGDVKYHLGFSSDVTTVGGQKVHLSLVANPSHLEASNAVVMGKTRAKQHYLGDNARRRAMSVLLHGDAAFAGQGVVYETMELSEIRGYTTGGTVHFIVNNQIGFTTDPRFARSSPYCTDVAKAVGAPIFHVNADDVLAVSWVCQTAAEFKQQFGRDVVVDIVGYRRYGHNEVDEPSFTQPLMYNRIAKTKPVLAKFQETAQKAGLLTPEEIARIEQAAVARYETAFEEARSGQRTVEEDALEGYWSGFKNRFEHSSINLTGVSREKLLEIGRAISSYPADFNLHKGLVRVMKAKQGMFESGEGVDWATAEALAFGTLLKEGVHVRLSGQDVERGTFSHRHCVLHDQDNESKYMPLNMLSRDPSKLYTGASGLQFSSDQAAFAVFNSNLSEYAVLGFELGYSMEHPMSLVLWEAQFGDFANTAQVMIDQFICAGEQKWLRQSGLVMLLPHGYEGQGPEHSSCRVERFLQLSDDDPEIIPDMAEGSRMQLQATNWQIVNCSTPANYFHVLRRQIKRDFRKPLVVVAPKSLLRHPQCVSSLSLFEEDRRFQRLIPERFDEELKPHDQIRRIILCTGKVYYDLLKYRREKGKRRIAMATVEQICPFPFDRVQEMARRYPNAEIVWVQEEPQNMGCWSYVQPRIDTALLGAGITKRVSYIGRNPAASPATGNGTIHQAEVDQLLHTAFDTNPAPDRLAPIRWRY